jgi:ribosomal-protein-alanine N-acetyltransferase
MIIAETERLRLRRLKVSDAEDLFRIYSGSGMLKYLGGGPMTLEEERRKLANHLKDSYDVHGFGLWGIVFRKTGRLIGRCGMLSSEINGTTEAELAYLVDRNWWGKGIATEAARAVLEVAAKQYKIGRIVAVIHPDNVGSISVAEKLGFNLESHLDSYKDFGNVLLYSRHLDPETANEEPAQRI